MDTVAGRLAVFEASVEARTLVAEIVAATLHAFTQTTSVRDPLPDTAPGTPEESLAAVAGIDHLQCSLAAVDATWQVLAEQRTRAADQQRGVEEDKQGRGAAHEIALARRVSPAASSLSLASSRRLVQQLPGTLVAMREGSITQQQASALARALDGAEPSTCSRIDELISEEPLSLQGMGTRRLRSTVRAMIQELEPHTSRERAERAARARHVTMTPRADGMARVSAVLRGIDAAVVMQTLHRGAQSLRAAGAKDSVPALEADLLVDAVRRGSAELASKSPRTAPPVDVGIIITDTALLSRRDDTECAQLEGYGAIPAHIVTDTLLGTPPGFLRGPEGAHPDDSVTTFYRRLYTSPSTGELIGMESRARAFPTGLARMIRWRDGTCRTPWCNAIIRQIDHISPHHRGGSTSYGNGQGLCVRCNLLKEHGLWILAPLSPTPSSVVTATPTTANAPPSAAHPLGWAWRSPHGAHGISPTPRILGPRNVRPNVEVGSVPTDHGSTVHVVPAADTPAPIPPKDPDPPSRR